MRNAASGGWLAVSAARITPPPGTSLARARFHRKRAKMLGPIIEEKGFQRQGVRMELGSNMIIAVDLLRGINVGF